MIALLCHHDESAAFGRKASKRLLKMWTHTAKAFGISNLIVIGEKESVPYIGDEEIAIEVFSHISEARAKYSEFCWVVAHEEGYNVDEYTYELPEDVIFAVGSNYADPVLYEDDIVVSIDSQIPLWDIVAAGIILHEANKWRSQ